MGAASEVMDDLDALFEDLYYPGSKRKRRPAPEPSGDEDRWDAHPIVKTRKSGEKTEFFLPGALAKALGRSSVTIRTWERAGYIPSAPFRLPGYTDARGKKHPGKRVYTRELINIAVEEFAARDLLGAKRVEWKLHDDLTIALIERWNAALEKE